MGQQAAEGLTDVILSAYDIQEQRAEEHLAKQMKLVDQEHDLAVAAAGDSAFKRQMAEEKYIQAKNKLEDDYEKERKKRAKKEKTIAIIQSQIDTARAITSTIASAPTVAAKIAGAVLMGALGTAQTAMIAATPLRKGGVLTGPGGPTSDSIFVRGSRGERMLSTNDISSLGGNDRIQQMIDRGDTYNNSNSDVHFHGTVIGTKRFVREEMIPMVRKELSR